MPTEIEKHDGGMQVTVKLTGSLFEAEQAILNACNDVGTLFDTDGSPIQVMGAKLTAKQPAPIVTKHSAARQYECACGLQSSQQLSI
jgi:hypothetical protein